jgi:WD40 repeat protein
MAKGIFLANPELNLDDVDVTATSELGRRAGAPLAFDTNSDLLNITTIGDSGDDADHDIEILGNQQIPLYAPLDADGTRYYTAPETFATMGATIACGSAARIALVAADDRLYAIVADGSDLTVYAWTGSAWDAQAAITTLMDHGGGIAAAAIGQNVYIALGNNADGTIELYRFNTRADTIGQLAQSLVATDGSVAGIALATNGALFSLLVTRQNGSGPETDVDVYFGTPGSMSQKDDTINDLFSSTWSTGDDVRCCALGYDRTYGFVAAFRCGAGSPASLRVAISTDGDGWREFEDLNGDVAQPTVSTPWADAEVCALAIENRRVFIWRATAAVQDDPPTDVKMQWFDGASTWSSEVDADGGVAIHAGTPIAATNWRGQMHFGWRSSSSAITVRRCNGLTLTNTGYYREIRFGEPMFIAGLDDDSRTALFFVASGSITAGDKFRIQAAEYDYRVEHLLDDFLVKVWRGTHNAEQVIQFDAGSGRAFALDAIAVLRTNLPSIAVQLDDDVNFASPSTDQEILATVQTASVVSANRNRIVFADGTFREKQYAPGTVRHWVSVSTGVFRILDNTHNALIVEGSATGATATSATIFRDSLGHVFATPPAPKRYLRLVTPTLALPDGYYEISRVIFGLRLSLPRNFSNGFAREQAAIETVTQLKSGARFYTSLNSQQRDSFVLPWQVVKLEQHLRSLTGLFALSRGGRELVAFWPFPTGTGDQPEVCGGRFIEPLGYTHINKDFYSVGGARFETEVP